MSPDGFVTGQREAEDVAVPKEAHARTHARITNKPSVRWEATPARAIRAPTPWRRAAARVG
jgi:hypothetical protein